MIAGRILPVLRGLTAAIVLSALTVTADAALAAEGPALGPAAFKPLPVGTKVKYDDRNLTVKTSEGFRTVYRVWVGGKKAWLGTHALFGEYATDLYVYHDGGDAIAYEIDDANKSKLEALWPLEIGKETRFQMIEEAAVAEDRQTWTISLKVVKTDVIKIKKVRYATFLIEERARSSGGMSFVRKKWYHPQSGLVLKSTKTWTGKNQFGYSYKKISYFEKDEEENYLLNEVDFPEGTTTHALTGTEVESDVDKTLLAEVSRLKQAVEAVRDGIPGGGVSTAVEGVGNVDFGRYHALIIGIDKYKYLPNLETAVRDAKAVADVLKNEYGFKVTLLIDPDRLAIIDALDEMRETLGGKDNLLIYYAGHGWLDEDADRGYWLPANAKSNRRARWISNATITDTLKTLQAKHVMVVADSCYSGTLTRAAKIGIRSGDYLKRMAEKWARVALVSGGLEPVADKGGSGHSPFAKAFLDVLRGNDSILDGTELFSKMRRPVMVSADQTPEYSDVRNAGHDGGDFLFVKKK